MAFDLTTAQPGRGNKGKFDLTTVVPEKEPESWYEDFGEGVGVSGLELYTGLKDLVPGVELNQGDKDRLADWQADADESGWGTAGQVAGEVGQMFTPMGWAGKAAKLPKAARMLKSPILRDAVKSAGLAGARVSDTDEDSLGAGSRLENAAVDLGFSAAGSQLAKQGSKLLKGSPKTEAAKFLESKGVYLTPGQSGDHAGNIEDLMEVLPGLSQGTIALKQEAVDSYRNKILTLAHPTGKAVSTDPMKASRQIRQGFSDGYDEAWAMGDGLIDQEANALIKMAKNAKKHLPSDEGYKIDRIVKDIKTYSNNETPDMLNKIDKSVSKAKGSTKNPYAIDEFNALRDEVRSHLPEEALEELKYLDGKYPEFLAVKDAVKASSEKGGRFTPKQLAGSSRKIGNQRTALGDAPFQEYITAAGETLGKKGQGAPLDWLRRMAHVVPSPIDKMKGVAPTVHGGGDVQKFLADIIGKAPLGKTAPALGGLLYDDE